MSQWCAEVPIRMVGEQDSGSNDAPVLGTDEVPPEVLRSVQYVTSVQKGR